MCREPAGHPAAHRLDPSTSGTMPAPLTAWGDGTVLRGGAAAGGSAVAAGPHPRRASAVKNGLARSWTTTAGTREAQPRNCRGPSARTQPSDHQLTDGHWLGYSDLAHYVWRYCSAGRRRASRSDGDVAPRGRTRAGLMLLTTPRHQAEVRVNGCRPARVAGPTRVRRRTMMPIIAQRTIVSERAGLVSYSRARLRWAVSHEKVRSTAHRFDWTWKPPLVGVLANDLQLAAEHGGGPVDQAAGEALVPPDLLDSRGGSTAAVGGCRRGPGH